MKRTKEWWDKLTHEERCRLVWLEKAEKNYGGVSAYLPDDCSECSSCSCPSIGSGGLCISCSDELTHLLDKAGA